MEKNNIEIRVLSADNLERLKYLFNNTNVSKILVYSTGEIGVNYSGGIEYDGMIKYEIIKALNNNTSK